jgi:hypothetical protein
MLLSSFPDDSFQLIPETKLYRVPSTETLILLPCVVVLILVSFALVDSVTVKGDLLPVLFDCSVFQFGFVQSVLRWSLAGK